MIRKVKYRRLAAGLFTVLPICALTYWGAFLLRFEGQLSQSELSVLATTIVWAVGIKALTLVQARLHLDFSRYVTFRDMVLLIRTVTIASVGITLVDTMILTDVVIPRSVIVLDWAGMMGLLASIRIFPRLIRDAHWSFQSSEGRIPALIVGANDSGEALLRSIRQRSDQLHYKPVGFVDDQVDLLGRRISGVPVLGRYNEVAELVHEHGVEEVLITAGSLPGKQVRLLTDQAQQYNFRVKVLPSYEQLLQEKVAIQPRQVAIADLLQRPAVKLDTEQITRWIKGKTVLVTGSAGSIGSEICRQVLRMSPKKIVVVDRSETGQFFLERELRELAPDVAVHVALADLTDRGRLETVFSEHQPHIVFHAAAYKHVPLMEDHVGEAIKNIVMATRNLVDLTEENQGEGFVMISTDKAVNPTSVMGSCKRLAEQYVQAKAETSSCRLVTVRFGNVLDSAGSVVPIFRDQIARGGPVTVTHPDMIRYFMLIPEAAQLVIQAGAMGQGGEIFVLDMGEPVRIMDLAKDMIRLSGLRVGDDIEIEVTGLRPGEKMFEELYDDTESNRATGHEKIMVAASQPQNLLRVLNDISHLSEIVDEPNEYIREALRGVIPLYSNEKKQLDHSKKAA